MQLRAGGWDQWLSNSINNFSGSAGLHPQQLWQHFRFDYMDRYFANQRRTHEANRPYNNRWNWWFEGIDESIEPDCFLADMDCL